MKEFYFLVIILIFQLYQLYFLVGNYRRPPWLDLVEKEC